MKEVSAEDVQHVRELVNVLLEAEDVNDDEHDDKQQVLQHTQDDAAVRRFVRAAGHNLKGAAKRLVATARWRIKERPEQMTCMTCAKSATAHFMHPVGHDKQGRPVLFSSYLMIEDAAAKGATEHMLCEFERAIKLMPSGVESWCWFMDFSGYGRRLADLSPTLAVNFLHLSAAHYPERLGALWILDAPAVLLPVWRWLKPMIDPVTHAKFRFLPFDVPLSGPLPALANPTATTTATTTTSHADATAPKEPHAPAGSHTGDAGSGGKADQRPSQLWAALNEACDEELATWVATEMRAARAWDAAKRTAKRPGSSSKQQQQQQQAQRPVYDTGLLQRALQEEQQGLPQLLARLGTQLGPGAPAGGDADAGAGGAAGQQQHCHYGTRALLAKLLEQGRRGHAVVLPVRAAAASAGDTASAEADGQQQQHQQ